MLFVTAAELTDTKRETWKAAINMSFFPELPEEAILEKKQKTLSQFVAEFFYTSLEKS